MSLSRKRGDVLAVRLEYRAMFESRSRYDRVETRPQHSLRRGIGPRQQGSGDALPPNPPRRPTPRPLHTDPPILMIGRRHRSVLASRGFMGMLLVLCAFLVTIPLARLLESDRPDVSSRGVLPATPVAQPTAPAETRLPDVAQRAPDPSPSEPVTPAPAADSSEETVAASEQREEPEPSSATPEPVVPPVENAPAPARGFLFINSRPWGRVLIDGRPIGNTPVVRVPIAPGMHELRVERDGFHPFETIITVDPGTNLRMTEIVLRSVIS